MENQPNHMAKLEALLFQYGEPLAIDRIANMLGIKEKTCINLIKEYETLLKNENRGLVLLQKDNRIQLITKPELESVTGTLIKDEFREKLTPASLETLTIVAYLGPIDRAHIDYVRGVNSSFTLRGLLMRGLIERVKKGNTYEYSISFDFLKHMGLQRVDKLPEYEKYHNILERFEAQEVTNDE